MKKNQEKSLNNVNNDQFESAYNKCLHWFYSLPTRTIGLSKLSSQIKSSKKATTLAVQNLISSGFLFRQIAGRSWILSANPKHSYLLTKKMPFHLSKIYESGIIEAVHQKIPQARAIVLFGSFRWGTDIEGSDIDIAVEVIDNQNLKIISLGTINEFGYRKNVPVNLHVFSRNKIDLNLFSNIANGILLDGFLEVKP